MGIAECAKPITSASPVRRKIENCISLTLKGPHAVTSSSYCISGATFHPPGMMNQQSNPKLYVADWTAIVCASVVAATGGIKNCGSGELLPVLLQMRNQFSGSGGKIHILQSMERRHEEPRMRRREWKPAPWDSGVKLTRGDDRTSPQSQTVSCKLLELWSLSGPPRCV